MSKIFESFKHLYLAHRRLIFAGIAVIIIAPIALVIGCHILVSQEDKYILSTSSKKHVRVGLVLGAGITKDGKPFKELQARLDVAAKAMQKGQVDKLLLSGDNRFKNYDEPTAMRDYLVNVKHIQTSKLQRDFAGRSTYESCDRAHKVFGLSETIIYSAPTHLPRAIYLCRHLGVTAYGVSSNVDANNGQRRELQANVKAVYNLYIHGENTVLGPPVRV
jgi:vancomycin permeability regulator SanA